MAEDLSQISPLSLRGETRPMEYKRLDKSIQAAALDALWKDHMGERER